MPSSLSLRTPAGRARGGWTLDATGLAPIPGWRAGPAVVLAPTEHILLTTVDLPAGPARERLSVLAYGLEDALGQPIEDMAFALGAPRAGQRPLATAVARSVLEAWIAQLEAQDLGHAVIAPDVLAIPVPPARTWGLQMRGPRALVRTDDGAGFAVDARLLPAAWAAAGQPAVIAYGPQAPPLPFAPGLAPASPAEPFSPTPIDLRQGPFARRGDRALVGGLLAIGLATLIAHGAVLAIEAARLQGLALERRAEALAAVRRAWPATPQDADLAEALDILAEPADRPFGPLLAKTSAALLPLGDRLRLRALAFDARDQGLTLTVEADDLAALQRVNSALLQAGLAAVSGAASLQDGAAVGEVVVREPAS